jgi:hypothetical protein
VSYRSEGQLLIVGPGARALPWAEQLAGEMSVSVLLTDSGTELPAERRYPIWSGRAVAVKGYLGVPDGPSAFGMAAPPPQPVPFSGS